MIDIPVSSVMTSPVQTVSEEATASTVAGRFVADGIGALVVTDPATGEMLGIVTESDIIRQVARGTDVDAATVSTFMSAPVTTITGTETIARAAELMETHSIRRLPVVDDRELVGIVTTTDLTHYIPRLRRTLLRERTAA